jgi:hypothetical protein
VAAGVSSNEFVACDEKLVTQAILGALNWTARWYRPEGVRSPRDVGDAFAEFLVRGLLVPAATTRRAGGRRP